MNPSDSQQTRQEGGTGGNVASSKKKKKGEGEGGAEKNLFITLRQKDIGVLKSKLGNARIASTHTSTHPLAYVLITL